MIAALQTEYRKLVTTRLWWVLLLATVGYLAFMGAVLAFAFTVGDAAGPGMGGGQTPLDLPPAELARTIYTLGPAFGYVFPAVIGAMSVTGEFRHKTITPTFLAEPRRGVVLAAKLVASLPIGLAFGLAGTVGTVLGGAPVLALVGDGAALGEPEVLRSLGLSVIALAVWCMVGVGFGTVLTNQVAAIVVLLAFTQLVEPLARIVLGAFEVTAGVAKWLPGAAGEAITGASLYSAAGMSELLPWWAGLAVLVGYGLLLAAVGRLTTLRRDIT